MQSVDYDLAAIRACETLIKYDVTAAPVSPLRMLKETENVIVLSFAEIAFKTRINRTHVISTFGSSNQDAVTTVIDENGKLTYFVAYNQRLPYYISQRALARELGHIVMLHDGSRSEDVRIEEAEAFARHLLCPRALIRSLQEENVKLTAEIIGNISGCYERCLINMSRTPGAHVPLELNRQIKVQFAEYVKNYVAFYNAVTIEDYSALADFGTYMDNYVD